MLLHCSLVAVRHCIWIGPMFLRSCLLVGNNNVRVLADLLYKCSFDQTIEAVLLYLIWQYVQCILSYKLILHIETTLVRFRFFFNRRTQLTECALLLILIL